MSIKRTTKTRIAAIAIAAAATFAVAPGAASAEAATIKADVGLWMQYQPAGNGVAKGFIYGGVSSDNKNCLNTTINFGRQHNWDPNTWNYGWNFRNVTKQDPTYSITLENADRGYQYTTWTGKQVIRKNGNKIVCNYGTQQDLIHAN